MVPRQVQQVFIYRPLQLNLSRQFRRSTGKEVTEFFFLIARIYALQRIRDLKKKKTALGIRLFIEGTHLVQFGALR